MRINLVFDVNTDGDMDDREQQNIDKDDDESTYGVDDNTVGIRHRHFVLGSGQNHANTFV